MRWSHTTLNRQGGFDEKTATLLVSTMGCRTVIILTMAPVVMVRLKTSKTWRMYRQTRKSALPSQS